MQTSYSGNQTTVTDEAGKQRTSQTDALGRLIAVWEDPGSSPHLNYKTEYQYNLLDNLLCAVQKGTDTAPFTNCASAPSTWRSRSCPFPANGCLAKLLLWPRRRIARPSLTEPSHTRFESLLFQAPGDLRLLLTFTYHGCP